MLIFKKRNKLSVSPPALSCSEISETMAGLKSAPRFDVKLCSGISYF